MSESKACFRKSSLNHLVTFVSFESCCYFFFLAVQGCLKSDFDVKIYSGSYICVPFPAKLAFFQYFVLPKQKIVVF